MENKLKNIVNQRIQLEKDYIEMTWERIEKQVKERDFGSIMLELGVIELHENSIQENKEILEIIERLEDE